MSVELNVGDRAPAFRAEAFGGKYGTGRQISLADFRGSNVVLYFYPKDDTPGCTVQACGLRDAWGDFNERANIFGVSVDSGASHEKFIKKYQLPFPLLADTEKKIVESYGVWVEKACTEKNIWASSGAHLLSTRPGGFRRFSARSSPTSTSQSCARH
jgi:peroxiredoxin Q/BCP